MIIRILTRSILGLSATVALMALAPATPALANKPWWELSSGTAPAILQTGLAKGEAQYLAVTAVNMGDADLSGAGTPVTITDKLPPGLKAVSIEGAACSLEELSCTSTGIMAPYEEIRIFIGVEVEGAKSGEVNEVLASGGNAPAAKTARPITVGDTPTPFGVEEYELKPEEEGGTANTQAGSHPFQLTTTLNLNQRKLQLPYGPFVPLWEAQSPALAKDLNFKLPPGLIGNPTPFPQCTIPQFDKDDFGSNECANDTAVGVATVLVQIPISGNGYIQSYTVPVFNLTPSTGEPARFGFQVNGVLVYLDPSVRTGGDYGVTVNVNNITQEALFLGSRVTFWGVPGDPRHDNARGWSCVADGFWRNIVPEKIAACTPLGQHQPPPLLELPTSCTGPLQTTVEADSWSKRASSPRPLPPTRCPRSTAATSCPSHRRSRVAPDGEAASTPTG